MTNRDFYTAVAANEITDEVMAFAAAAIEKMDATNEKRCNTPSKAQIENQPLIDKILDEVLTTEPMTASDVAAALGVSTQKASALLRNLDGVVQSEVKLPKKGTVKAYALAD